jgi:hypothetical protein
MTWALQEAGQRGFDVDQEKLRQWNDWALDHQLSQREEDEELVGSSNLDGLSQLLLGRDDKQGHEHREAEYRQFIDLILEGQQDDGSWSPGGQLPAQKRPKLETTEVSTMWIGLSLLDWNPQSERVQTAIAKATQRLENSSPGKSTEWWVGKLLIKDRLGEARQAAEISEAIRSQQNADGGFGWLAGQASDAMATGQVLYAWSLSETDTHRPAIRRMQDYLVRHQREDGSWEVASTKASRKGKPAETASYWGSAWATLGLLHSLDE